MTKKQINNLVIQSYIKDNLDPKKIQKNAVNLSRKDLKKYIRAIKNWEKKQSVEVIVPSKSYSQKISEKNIKTLFSKKKIKYSIDPSIIAGVKIINDDDIYDFNFKKTLDAIIENIEKQYD